MEIKYQRHTKRAEKAKKFWSRVANDYNTGLTASEIAKRYTNPKTHRHYTREHIYWILKQASTK